MSDPRQSECASSSPQLIYPGKLPAADVLATPPAVLRPVFAMHDLPDIDAVYAGDNIAIMAALRQKLQGKIDLVYIDPPYATGRDFVDADGLLHFGDRAKGANFIEELRHRLILIHELLSERGTLYLHIDQKMSHYARVLLDEIFGPRNFISDIARVKCSPKQIDRAAFGNMKDVIYVYAKRKGTHIWNDVREPLTKEQVERQLPHVNDEGRRSATVPPHAPGETKNGPTGQPWRDRRPPKGSHWQYPPKFLDELDAKGRIAWSRTGNPRRYIYEDEHRGNKIQDVWLNFKDPGKKAASYSTQKNQDMLDLIVANSSSPESVVLDAYAGSGSALMAAHKQGRRFIAIDASPESIEAIRA